MKVIRSRLIAPIVIGLGAVTVPIAAQPTQSTESVAARAAAAGLPDEFVLTGATILDGTGRRIEGDVLVHDGKIAALGYLPDTGQAMRIDVTGRWITPGIIDVHTHYGTYLLPQTLAPSHNADVTETSGPNAADTWIEDSVRPADPAFSRALRGGVTTLQILPGSSVMIGGRSVVVHPIPAITIEQMRIPEAKRGLKMACGSNSLEEANFPTSRQGQIAFIKRAFLAAQKYNTHETKARRHDNGSNSKARHHDRDPVADEVSKTMLGVLNGEIPVHLHCYRAEDISNWINLFDEFGTKITAVHHAAEAYKIAAFLARKETCVVTWPDWWGFKREAEDAIPENAAFIDAVGGCVVLHSDIPVLGSMLNLEVAKAAAAGRRAGLDIPPERAIRWITSNAARSLDLDDRIGSLAPGMNADLVVWSGDPFSVYSSPQRVFIDGKLVFSADENFHDPPSDFDLGRPQREELK